MTLIIPPQVDTDTPLIYKVKITGLAVLSPSGGFNSLGSAVRYVRKLTAAGQSQENIYIDEYYGSFATGVWYRYEPRTLTLYKNSK